MKMFRAAPVVLGALLLAVPAWAQSGGVYNPGSNVNGGTASAGSLTINVSEQ